MVPILMAVKLPEMIEMMETLARFDRHVAAPAALDSSRSDHWRISNWLNRPKSMAIVGKTVLKSDLEKCRLSTQFNAFSGVPFTYRIHCVGLAVWAQHILCVRLVTPSTASKSNVRRNPLIHFVYLANSWYYCRTQTHKFEHFWIALNVSQHHHKVLTITESVRAQWKSQLN